MEKVRFVCPCHFGLESVLKYEVGKIGGEEIAVSDGRVAFSGDVSLIAAANLRLSTAERVYIELGRFAADTFDMLFEGTAALPLERFIGRTDAFPVKGHSINSKLHSIPDCQSIIKKAACRRLGRIYGVERLEESGAVHQICFSIMKDNCSIYLDTSGAGLHKRGYRRNSNAAPIKETLAAGITDLARVRPDSIVCDPMCGSGTLVIESAYKALNIAPGLRRNFAAMKWEQLPQQLWQTERAKAMDEINKTAAFKALGADIDPQAAELTLQNIKNAGVSSKITVKEQDVRKFTPPDGAITICNPPYGERMLELKQARELYKLLGERIRPDSSRHAVIISPDEDFEQFFGKRADKKRKLYNGMIKCTLYMYFK